MSCITASYAKCAFCREMEAIYARNLSTADRMIAEDELWERAGRARRARRQYGQRKGYVR
jgi:hypothetical protein